MTTKAEKDEIQRVKGLRVAVAHRGKVKAERNAAIVDEVISGRSYRQVGQDFGVSYERVRQIMYVNGWKNRRRYE